ncbi:MAG: protein kinase [Muribaculaceae bacterium]|nr:protein kinase [Muribaculaceae bacterium]
MSDQLAQRCNFSIGDVINGEYTVTRILGEGSFGKVYSVSDGRGAQYALKLLKLWEVPPEIRGALVSRFDMEFETGRISSDYLVHSISHGIVKGNPYIVMEFCPGGDLIKMQETQRLDFSKIASQVLYGLRDLHRSGKVHRDLKPENVLVKADGNFALTDFGISGDRNKRMTERNILGKPKQIFGTYAYMPPEQLNPRKDATVLPTTDIFSFGVMMYQLITGGALPFGPLEDERDLVPYLKRGKAGDWDQKTLSMSPDGMQWRSLMAGCLHPKFQERFQTVDEVLRYVPNVQPHEQRQAHAPSFQMQIVNGVLLRVMQGEEYGRVYRLDDMLRGDCAVLTVGRSDRSVNNDIAILETGSSYISRCHCTLELDYEIGKWVIRDGQWQMNTGVGGWRRSVNGTYVNSAEVPVSGMPFDPGDIISIGDVKLRAEAY